MSACIIGSFKGSDLHGSTPVMSQVSRLYLKISIAVILRLIFIKTMIFCQTICRILIGLICRSVRSNRLRFDALLPNPQNLIQAKHLLFCVAAVTLLSRALLQSEVTSDAILPDGAIVLPTYRIEAEAETDHFIQGPFLPATQGVKINVGKNYGARF